MEWEAKGVGCRQLELLDDDRDITGLPQLPEEAGVEFTKQPFQGYVSS